MDYILDRLMSACGISARMMFGECALRCDGKVVGQVCVRSGVNNGYL